MEQTHGEGETLANDFGAQAGDEGPGKGILLCAITFKIFQKKAS